MAETKLQKDWTRVAYGDVVRKVNDRVDPETSGLERYVAGEHMDTDDLRIRRWGIIGDGYLGPAFHMRFKRGQVLYGSRRTYLRKVAVLHFEGVTANTTFVLESKDPKILLPDLLPFIMQTESFHQYSIEQSKGSVNPYINYSDLTKYEFALPSLEEQRRIAEVLLLAHELIEQDRVLLRQLRALRESWLEQEFLSLMREWPQKIARDLMERITVGIVVRPADLYVSPEAGGVPALRSLNVLPYQIITEELVHISQAGHVNHSKSRLRSGDVVIVRSGRPGDAAVIPSGFGELNCIDLIICGPSEYLDPEFFCAALNSRFGRRQFAAGTAGTAQKHFNVGALKNFRVPVPPLDLQERFVRELRGVSNLVADAETRLDKSRELATALLREVFER